MAKKITNVMEADPGWTLFEAMEPDEPVLVENGTTVYKVMRCKYEPYIVESSVVCNHRRFYDLIQDCGGYIGHGRFSNKAFGLNYFVNIEDAEAKVSEYIANNETLEVKEEDAEEKCVYSYIRKVDGKKIYAYYLKYPDGKVVYKDYMTYVFAEQFPDEKSLGKWIAKFRKKISSAEDAKEEAEHEVPKMRLYKTKEDLYADPEYMYYGW